ncbi:MAG: metallophosphoesterase family protein [Thermodesulfobacteriota bacterium]
MRLAVLSDIHANLEALEKVLEDIDRCNVDDTITLGDNIGYGPDPDGVIDILCRRQVGTIMGNHELALSRPNYLAWFNPVAQKALVRTMEMLSSGAMEWIAGLDVSMVRHGFRFVHGFPPDSATRYLFQVAAADMPKVFQELKEPVCYIGHTHEVAMISFDGDVVDYPRLTPGIHRLQPDHRYIINVGSVGQPRDRDRNAKYVIMDTELRSIELRIVEYDRLKTAAKIIRAGLPKLYADRLL